MLGRLVAILTFSRRTGSLTGPAKVIDGDTIVVAGEMVRLHGIDAPELDQPFWWRGQQLVGGMMALAALEALTAGVKVRCKAVERDRHGRLVAKVLSPNGVDIGRKLMSAGWAYRRYSTDYVNAEAQGQARHVEGNFRETLGVARIVTAAANSGIFVERSFAVLKRKWSRRESVRVGYRRNSGPVTAEGRERVRNRTFLPAAMMNLPDGMMITIAGSMAPMSRSKPALLPQVDLVDVSEAQSADVAVYLWHPCHLKPCREPMSSGAPWGRLRSNWNLYPPPKSTQVARGRRQVTKPTEDSSRACSKPLALAQAQEGEPSGGGPRRRARPLPPKIPKSCRARPSDPLV